MTKLPRPAPDRRFVAAVLSALIHAGALAALLLWHFAPTSREAVRALTVVDLPEAPRGEPPPPPPPPPAPQPTPGSAKAEAAGAPAPRAEAAPLAAAIPVAVPTVAPAPIPSTGVLTSSGAAAAGTGTGAGGTGTGTGGGGSGNGGGGAAERQREGTEPRITRGDFKPSDYPKALRQTQPRGRTWTEVMVGINGRPLSCSVSRSSGTALLDTETCRIIMQRFRFRPGRDAANKPVVAPFYIDIGWEYLDLTEE